MGNQLLVDTRENAPFLQHITRQNATLYNDTNYNVCVITDQGNRDVKINASVDFTSPVIVNGICGSRCDHVSPSCSNFNLYVSGTIIPYPRTNGVYRVSPPSFLTISQ